MTIQIPGTGYPKCEPLTANAKAAIEKAGLDAKVVKVSDVKEIIVLVQESFLMLSEYAREHVLV